MTKRVLITGITGQDGYWLTGECLQAGDTVWGLVHGQRNSGLARLRAAYPQVNIVSGDMRDLPSLIAAIRTVDPAEVYNLAAISHVGMSFGQPELTAEVTGLGVLRLLEAVRLVNDQIKVFQASSSEMFGNCRETPQDETTPYHPRSPYASAKVFAHHTAVNYREAYGMWVSCGIMFNHESELRGPEFVTRKITRGLARMKHGSGETLVLGDVTTRRDWGYAPEYMRAARLILAADRPDDWVVATGEDHSVGEWLEASLAALRMDRADWGSRIVVGDPGETRPADVAVLRGDAGKLRRVTGWEPTVGFGELVARMCAADDAAARVAVGSGSGGCSGKEFGAASGRATPDRGAGYPTGGVR